MSCLNPALCHLKRISKIPVYLTRGAECHVNNVTGHSYHYYNAEQPDAAELKREQQEEALVKELLRRTDRRMKVMEPCVMESDCESEANCSNCAYGSRCICGKAMPGMQKCPPAGPYIARIPANMDILRQMAL